MWLCCSTASTGKRPPLKRRCQASFAPSTEPCVSVFSQVCKACKAVLLILLWGFEKLTLCSSASQEISYKLKKVYVRVVTSGQAVGHAAVLQPSLGHYLLAFVALQAVCRSCKLKNNYKRTTCMDCRTNR